MATPCEHPWVGAWKEEKQRKRRGKAKKKLKSLLKSRSVADKIHHLGRKSHFSAAAKEHFRARPFLMYSCNMHPAFSFTVPFYPVSGDAAPVVRGLDRAGFLVRYFLQTAFSVFSFSLISFFYSYFCLSENLVTLMMLGAENTWKTPYRMAKKIFSQKYEIIDYQSTNSFQQ